MREWQILRCNRCKKVLGIKQVLDEDGVALYCLGCGEKELKETKLGVSQLEDWKYGIGWFTASLKIIKKEMQN